MSSLSQLPSMPSENPVPLPADGEPLETILAENRSHLVPAGELPPAAAVLAELFPEDSTDTAFLPNPANDSTLTSVGDLSQVAIPDGLGLSDELELEEQVVRVTVAAASLDSESEGAPSPAIDSLKILEAESVAVNSNDISPDSAPSGNADPAKNSGHSGIGSLLRRVSALFASKPKHRSSRAIAKSSEGVDVSSQVPESSGELSASVEANSLSEPTLGKPLDNPSAEPTKEPLASSPDQNLRSVGPVEEEVQPAENAISASEEFVANNRAVDGSKDRNDSLDVSIPAHGFHQNEDSQRTENEDPSNYGRSFAGPAEASSESPIDKTPVSPDSSFNDGSDAAPVIERIIEPVPEEDEAVDPRDDDAAIAAAIERYANLTDPDRAKDHESQQHNARSEGRDRAAEETDLNAVLGIPRDSEPAESALRDIAASIQIPDIEELPNPSVNVGTPLIMEQVPAAPEASQTAVPTTFTHASNNVRDWSFEEKLASHHEWIDSKGASGKRVDFAAADLEGSDLIGVNLRYMDLHDANLRAADLLMADLRDACLVRANFRDSCLVGANLEAANLEGAELETSMGLVPRQLAGANLHEATLPPQVQFEALPEFERSSGTVYAYFAVMTSLCVLSCVAIWTTKDFQLLTNASIIPFLHSPAAAAALPTVQFYLIAPFALFIVYLVFHFHLQHLWDLVLELPAVFPDGRALGENEPRIVVGLLRTHFRWMNQDAPSTRVIEKAIAIFVAYWIVPATLVFYWLRYLTLQEIHGAVLQELLIVGASGVAFYSTTKVGKPAARWTIRRM